MRSNIPMELLLQRTKPNGISWSKCVSTRIRMRYVLLHVQNVVKFKH